MAPGMLSYVHGAHGSGGHAPGPPAMDHARFRELRQAHGMGSDLPPLFNPADPARKIENVQQPKIKPQRRNPFHSSLHETDSSIRSASADPHGRNSANIEARGSAPPVTGHLTATQPIEDDEVYSESAESNVEDEGEAPQANSYSKSHRLKLRERMLPEHQRSGSARVSAGGSRGATEGIDRSNGKFREVSEVQGPYKSPLSPTDDPTISSTSEPPTLEQRPPNGIDDAHKPSAASMKPPLKPTWNHPPPAIRSIEIGDEEHYARQHRQDLNTEHQSRNANQPQRRQPKAAVPQASRKTGRSLSMQEVNGLKLKLSNQSSPEQPTAATSAAAVLHIDDGRPVTAAAHQVADQGRPIAQPMHANSTDVPPRTDHTGPCLDMWEEGREVIQIEDDLAERHDTPPSSDLDRRGVSHFPQSDTSRSPDIPQGAGQGSSRKRGLDDDSLDYEPDVLYKKAYPALRAEPFDLDTSQEPSVFPQSVANNDLETKLGAAVALPNDKRQQFLKTLSMDDWEEAGQWLMEQFYEVTSHLAESRQQRRKIAMTFEEEVARRGGEVDKSITEIDTDLKEMRQQGMLFMTPRKSRG